MKLQSTPRHNEEVEVFLFKGRQVSPQSLPLLWPADSTTAPFGAMTTAPFGAVNVVNLYETESPHLFDYFYACLC
jgi:hypothetical protein